MLSLQERIADYHYAYGMWPDPYQSPHPYSIHDYFDKNTMNMFERAFTKGSERPSALEWQMQLEYILKHLKQCKKDHNHAYFTPKGCGLCMISEKFKAHIDDYKKKQQAEKETVRGVKINDLTIEKLKKDNKKHKQINKLKNYVGNTFIVCYLLFFAFLFKILEPIKSVLVDAGIFVQLLLFFTSIFIINALLKKRLTFLAGKNPNLVSMLYIFALACLIINFISLNALSLDVFMLAE